MKRYFGFLAILSAGLLGALVAAPAVSSLEKNRLTVSSVTPGQEPPSWKWPVSTPEAQGLDAKTLADLVTLIREGKEFPRLHCLLIIRHGNLDVDESTASIRLRDLLTMRSGRDYHERTPDAPHWQLNRLPKGWDKFYLDRP